MNELLELGVEYGWEAVLVLGFLVGLGKMIQKFTPDIVAVWKKGIANNRQAKLMVLQQKIFLEQRIADKSDADRESLSEANRFIRESVARTEERLIIIETKIKLIVDLFENIYDKERGK